MTKTGFLSLVLIALILLTPIHAVAGSCSRADLTGSWQVYVFFASDNGYWTCLNIKINAKGKVTIRSTVDSYGRQSTVSGVTGGKLTVSPPCSVTGSISLSSDTYPISIRIDQGALNKSKDTFGAVGLDLVTANACTISAYKR